MLFLTGQQEIEEACNRVEKRISEILNKMEEEQSTTEVPDLIVLPLYAALPPGNYLSIYRHLDRGYFLGSLN